MKNVLLVIVLMTTAWVLTVYGSELLAAFAEHPIEFAVVTGLTIVLIILQAVNFRSLISSVPAPRLHVMLRIWALANLANYLGPLQPGLAARIALLRSEGVPWHITATATARQLQLSTWTGIGILSGALMASSDARLRVSGALLAIVFLAWPFLLRTARLRLLPRLPTLGATANRRRTLSVFLSTPPIHGLWIFIAQYGLVALCVLITYHGFDADLSWHQALLLAAATTLSALFSLTPNNLGIQELLLAYAATTSGLSAGDSLAIAVIFRAAHLTGATALLIGASFQVHK